MKFFSVPKLRNGNLSSRSLEQLDLILKSPVAQKILEQQEVQNLEKRRAMMGQLKAARKAQDGQKSDFGVAAKRMAYENAVIAQEKALHAYMNAMGEQAAAGILAQFSICDLEQQLRKGADPRLQDFLFVLDDRRESVRRALQMNPITFREGMSKRSGMATNIEDMNAATDLIGEYITRCREMQLMDVSESQVTQALEEMCATLSKVLRPLDVLAPVIKNGEVAAA